MFYACPEAVLGPFSLSPFNELACIRAGLNMPSVATRLLDKAGQIFANWGGAASPVVK